jgi:hypothetical protein
MPHPLSQKPSKKARLAADLIVTILFRFGSGLGFDGQVFFLLRLFDTGGFAGKVAHIVDPGSPHAAYFHKFNLGKGWRIEREGAFDADAAGHLADNECLAQAMATTLNDDAFVDLNAFLFVFEDTDIHPDGVAARELRNVVPNLTGRYFFNEICVHWFFLLREMVSLQVHTPVTRTAEPAYRPNGRDCYHSSGET